MSDWFRSIPEYLDSVAFTGKVKFAVHNYDLLHITSFNWKQWLHKYDITDPNPSDNECL